MGELKYYKSVGGTTKKKGGPKFQWGGGKGGNTIFGSNLIGGKSWRKLMILFQIATIKRPHSLNTDPLNVL